MFFGVLNVVLYMEILAKTECCCDGFDGAKFLNWQISEIRKALTVILRSAKKFLYCVYAMKISKKSKLITCW